MSDRAISTANLNYIENALSGINKSLSIVNQNIEIKTNEIQNRVDSVQDKVNSINIELATLQAEFNQFVRAQFMANRKNEAQTKLVKIRQELQKKFGHYDVIRRTTNGILQATDLSIIRKESITSATEEQMLNAPKYWLAPVLVALSAWINNDKALAEAIKRDDEKTSLFFALVCRRGLRNTTSFKWLMRYFDNQNPESLDRKVVVMLDAYTSGLLGVDSESAILDRLKTWINKLEQSGNFIDEQLDRWEKALWLKRGSLEPNEYEFLRQYSNTFDVLEETMQGALMHEIMYNYLDGIFKQKNSNDTIENQIDEILLNLTTSFDDEEVPLRREERLESLIVEYGGDESKAQNRLNLEQSVFESYKSLAQIFTDSAMEPKLTCVKPSTQQLSFAFSKEWIINAYNDANAKNRAKIPSEIEISIDTFNDKTKDGKDEKELIERLIKHIDAEEKTALKAADLTLTDKLFGLLGVAGIGGSVASYLFGNDVITIISGLVGVYAGLGFINTNTKMKKTKKLIREHHEKRRENGSQIIRALCAEIIDYKERFIREDSKDKKVIAFLENINVEQHINARIDNKRRINL